MCVCVCELEATSVFLVSHYTDTPIRVSPYVSHCPASASVRLSPPLALAFSLSLHRHPYSCIPLSSRFIHYNKQQNSSGSLQPLFCLRGRANLLDHPHLPAMNRVKVSSTILRTLTPCTHHPLHSQNSRLISTSLSLGIPFPRSS